jgi:hypothetical protein
MYGFIILSVVSLTQTAEAQVTIPVNQTQPCFFNYSAGADLWLNCGADEDYLDFALSSWEWITGGFFSMIVVSMFILVTYIKYQKATYPLMIGVMFLPVSFILFPDVFITWAGIMLAFAIGIIIWTVIIRQTKEYS